MSAPKPKFYTVWSGKQPGVYLTWDECKQQVIGVEGSRYKSFPTIDEARRAFEEGAPDIIRTPRQPKAQSAGVAAADIIQDAYAVDAACSGNPGMMEYQGVDVKSGIRLFHFGPIYGTNNIGEFLAIVHALALQQQRGTHYPIYSDSRNAQLWVKAKKCKTKLEHNTKTAKVHELIERAERWLQTHSYADIKILKWQTERWGEIPADFGRK